MTEASTRLMPVVELSSGSRAARQNSNSTSTPSPSPLVPGSLRKSSLSAVMALKICSSVMLEPVPRLSPSCMMCTTTGRLCTTETRWSRSWCICWMRCSKCKKLRWYTVSLSSSWLWSVPVAQVCSVCWPTAAAVQSRLSKSAIEVFMRGRLVFTSSYLLQLFEKVTRPRPLQPVPTCVSVRIRGSPSAAPARK